MEWEDWNGKRIFVKLRDGGCYTGDVIDVDVGQISFLTIIDKFQKKVTFATSEITKIVDEGE